MITQDTSMLITKTIFLMLSQIICQTSILARLLKVNIGNTKWELAGDTLQGHTEASYKGVRYKCNTCAFGQIHFCMSKYTYDTHMLLI